MSDPTNAGGGPDLVTGIPLSSVPDGAVLLELVGELEADRRNPCTITYRRASKRLAVAVVHRDLVGLRAEVEFEKAIRDSPS